MAETGRGLLTAFRDFSTHVAAGKTPPTACRVFFGASLCALSKECGGVRPIAVGMTLRRMVTKSLIKPGSDAIGDFLRPHQLGYATRGGCEAAVHAARHLSASATQTLVFLKLDIKNAFNTIHRSHVLSEVSRKMPSLYRFFYSAYSRPTALLFDSHVIESMTGAPALFSVGLQGVVEKLKARFNTWYLDDASLIEDAPAALADVRTLIPELKKLGLEVNRRKCEMALLNVNEVDREGTLRSFGSLLPELRILTVNELYLLGAPLALQQLLSSMEEKPICSY